ncbi:hypothetical protein F5J12DRAFT_830233 [Pisolithus orientalis]|uniref:uncharacterized protein n=1 Tax=Pisolithus orientalis TaxID=936130 RepID=UPI002224F079|nr:uncharacterized protein F5J12DRAFT_830233 [Pisolithus orientalis]KAI6007712.1 hypothetical protein F5J12DRAFT_830233 [Pisolithus orientalis]
MKVKPLALDQVRSCSLRPARRSTLPSLVAFRAPLLTGTPLTSASRLPIPSTARRRLHSTNPCSPDHRDARVHNAAQQSISKSDNNTSYSSAGDGELSSRKPYAGRGSVFPLSNSSLFDAALTSIVGLGIVFLGGVAYIAWYKKNVLDKIEKAFDGGYDPVLALADFEKETSSKSPTDENQLMEHLRRKEQDCVDDIIKGNTRGHYYFLIGPKGGGKSTLILDAMRSIQAEGVSILDVHPDLEVFRLRLGKALNYEFHEDSQTLLFQRRDPREAGPALDIERALNKLEKVALRKARKTGRPIVLVFNNVQHFNNDEDGRNMLLQLQQKAEAWAASGIVTTVFSSDDFWPCLLMHKAANRMRVLTIGDLSFEAARHALGHMRLSQKKPQADQTTIDQVVTLVGGRLSYLSHIARTERMLKTVQDIVDWEREWLLSQIGLIPDCDDDVMDEQKWSSCSWLLLKEFVRLYKERQKERQAAGLPWDPTELPSIPYGRCRQIMTRTDFIEELDRSNIISIGVKLDVRPDSMLILHAAREVVEAEGFDDLLQNVRDRIDEIESLHRTRELTFKDLSPGDKIRLQVEKSPRRLW